MNYSQLTIILHFLVLLANSLFSGSKIIVTVLFFHTIFKINYAKRESPLFIITANNVLLIGGSCFLLTVLSNTFFAWISGNIYEREIIISSITGPTWYQYITPVFNFALLPALLWSKKLRASIYTSFSIILIWLITTNLVEYFSREPEFILSAHKKQPAFDYTEFAENIVLYFVVFIIVYIITKRNKKTNQPLFQNQPDS